MVYLKQWLVNVQGINKYSVITLPGPATQNNHMQLFPEFRVAENKYVANFRGFHVQKQAY